MAEPTGADPAGAQPATAQPAGAESAVAKSEVVESAGAQSGDEEPGLLAADHADAARFEQASPADLAAASAQLGRPMRGVAGVAHRCGCGLPDVLATRPTLPDGTPFPTCYYLTCPRVSAAVGTLEASGVMAEMTARLRTDEGLALRYRAAHDAYLRDRAALGDEPLIAGVSAGGMPDRVKCLHVLAAHALAAGPGVNPLGDEVLAALAERGIRPQDGWGGPGRCVAD